LAARHSTDAGRIISYTGTFLVGFVVYEGALFAFSATLLGGTEIYTAAIQGRIFAVNAAAFDRSSGAAPPCSIGRFRRNAGDRAFDGGKSRITRAQKPRGGR